MNIFGRARNLSVRVQLALCYALVILGLPAAGFAADVTVTKAANPASPSAVLRNGTIHYTVTVNNSSSPTKTLTGVQVNDNLDSQITVTAGTVHASPVGIDDTYTVIGNTRLFVGQTPPAGEPNVTMGLAGDLTFGLLANDVTVTDAITLTTVSGAATTQGGLITINSDGSFIYTPPAGFTGTDKFVYSIRNSVDATLTDTATATFNVGNMVWYVNSAAGVNGDGRSNTPFNVLSGATSAQTSSAAGDFIFMFSSATNYTAGITLKNTQQLIGGGVALVVGGKTLLGAAARPSMITAGVTLATGNTLSGFNFGNVTGTAITGANVGTLAINNMLINNTTGGGLDLTGVSTPTVTITLDSLTSTGGTKNVNLVGLNGTISLGSGALSAASGNAFDVSGGAAVITYSGTIGNTAARSVNIANMVSAGTVTLSGAVSGSGTGINLANNGGGVGAQINFTGGVTLSTGANAAFAATGGGIVTVTGSNNTLTTTTGTALNVASTTIGASGLTFKSISANGGTNGIILNSTGNSGGLTVTGTVGSTSNDGSGGTIQGMTGADASPVETATVGVGIYLNATQNVSLNHMNLHDFSNYALNGIGVTGFTMTYTTVNGTNGTNQGGNGEGDVYFTGLSGSALVDHSTFSGAAYDVFHVFNNTGQTLNRFTATFCSFGSTNTAGNDALAFQATGGVLNVTVQDSAFTGERGDAFQMDLHGTMSSDLIFGGPGHGNTLSNNNTNSLGGGLTLGGGNAGDNVTFTLNVSNNIINGAIASAIGVGLGTGTHNTTGTIDSNQIGTVGVSASGTFGGSGIGWTHNGGGGHSIATITNNTVVQYGSLGISLNLGAIGSSNTGFLTATVTGNTLSNPVAATASNGFLLTAGTAGTPNPQDTGAVCLTMTGNSLNGSGVAANGQSDIRIRDRFDVKVGLPGYGGASTDGTAAITFVANNNKTAGVAPTATAPNPSLGTTNGTTNGFFGACPTGTLLFAPGGVTAAADVAARKDCGCAKADVAKIDNVPAPAVNATTKVENEFGLHREAIIPVQTVKQAQIRQSSSDALQPTGILTRSLSQEQLKPIIAAALQRWNEAGLSAHQIAMLKAVNFDVKRLPGGRLGEARQGHVLIADNGAGYGWYVDSQPLDNSEFAVASSATRFYTDSHSLPAGHLDLLTTVMHEMGHQLGLQDSYKIGDRESLMYGSLTMGERRLPAKGQAKDAVPYLFGDAVNYLTVSLATITTLPAGKTCTIKFDATVSNTATVSPILNQVSVNGGNIVGGPFLSNTASTDLNVPPTAFSAQTPPLKGDVNFAYAGYTFVADGTPTPTYALAPTSPALPGGLSIAPATGVLSGTPTSAGTFSNIVVRASNVAGFLDTTPFTMTIAPALTIAPASLVAATAGTATNQLITVSNGTTPYTTLNVTAFSAGTTGLTAAALTASVGAGTVTLSGTPTAAGTCTFTVNVTDTVGATLSKNYSLTVNAAITIAPAALAGATAGTATNQHITVSNGTTPYTTLNVSAFSAGTTGLTAAALTANAGAGTVTLSGTPTAAGTATFTVNVTDTAGATASKNYTLTVNAALSIAPAALAQAQVGQSTNQIMTISNGTTPYTTLNVTAFVAGGTGLTAANLTSNAGAGTVTLSGTPTAAGTCTFTVNVTDTAGATATKNYSLTVVAINITPASLPGATAGTAYSQVLTVNGAGLPLNSLTVTSLVPGATGLVAGNFTSNLTTGKLTLSFTPAAAGVATFTVNVTDSTNATASQNFSLTVNAALSIAPAALAQATAGTATNQIITVSGGTTPYTTLNVNAFSAGTTGLTAAALTANAGAGTVTLSGTPTAAGTCTFTVNVTDTAGASTSKNYTLTVNTALSIAPAALAAATATASTNQIITVSGGTTPYTTLNVTAFSAGTTGLTAAALTANAGAGTVTLSGTPTAAGTCTFTVNVTDTAGATATKNYSLTVNAALSIAPAALTQATAGTATNQTITVSGGTTPYTTLNVSSFVAGGTGLTVANLTPNSGAGTIVLSGTPTAAGACTFTVNVIDGAGATATKNYTLTVNPSLSIAPAALAAATANKSTSQNITVSGGTTPYSTVFVNNFSAGTTGLLGGALTANTGAGTVTLSGTPTAAGTCTFTVNVTDLVGATATKNYSLTVNPVISIAPAALAGATAGTATNQNITVSGGTTPYTTLNVTAFSAGTTGLTAAALTANAGAGTVTLSGTPTAAGTCTFTVNVTDTAGATLSKNYTLTVSAGLSIAPAALAGATAGTATNQNITVSGGTTPYTTVNVSAFSAGTTGLTAANLTANINGTVALSGTATAAGTCTFTVNVTDTAGASTSKNYTLTVNAALSIAPAALITAVVGVNTNQTMTVSNGTTPYTTLNVSAFVAGGTGLTTGNLTANAGAGTVVLNGTPTATGTCTFTVNVTDTAGATLSKNYSLTVVSITVTPGSPLPAGTATSLYAQTLTANNAALPLNAFTVTALVPGATGLVTGNFTPNLAAGTLALSFTPSAAGTATWTVNVTDKNNATVSFNYSLTINSALAITPAALAQATATKSTNQIITVSGGTKPYTTLNVTAFSAGTTGLTAANLTASAGAGTVTLSGTPTAAGTCTFTVNATDTANATISQNYTLTVNPALSIAPASLIGADVGLATNQTITVSNGTTPYTTLNVTAFSAGSTGLTAAALTANAGTGTVVLSGTPTATGTATFTVNVTDTAGATLSKNYSLTVSAALTIAPAALNAATAGTATNQTITVSNGTTPYTTLNVSAFSAGTTGLTAANLTANAGAGTVALSGTPTAAGTCTFTVNVTDTAGGTLAKNYTLTVNAALSIAPTVLAQATAGFATNQTITVSNGTTPYVTITLNPFNPGTTGLTPASIFINLGAGTVTLNGTPTAAGTATGTVNVTDTAGATLSQNYTLTVNPPITVAPPTLPGGTVYVAYSQTVSASGGTGALALAKTGGVLPPGLAFDTNTGIISGTPTLDGTFNFTITATDSLGAKGSQSYSVIIAIPTITVTPATLPPGVAGVAYSQQLSASGGLAPYTFTLTSGPLPTGITLSNSGLLSGTPTQAGTFSITVKATDSTPPLSGPAPVLGGPLFAGPASVGGPYSGSSTLSLTIGAPTIVVNAANLPNGKTGFPYPGATITATGGVAPYTFAITAGALPPGLTMSTAGVISGTPTLEVNATFTVTATDSTTGTGPFTGSAVGTISIDRKPVFTSGPSFDANATVANLVGTFMATTDPTTAIITWDFGDGSAKATGAPVTHTYTTPGTYTITVTATNPNSGTSTTVTLTIMVADSNHLPDTTHTIRTQGTLTFGTKLDSLVLQTILPLPAAFPTSGAVLQFGLNGIRRTFTFDGHGKAGAPGNSAILREYKFPGNGIPAAKISIKLYGALKSDATKGVSVNANGLPLKLLATFTINGQTYSDIPAVQFITTNQGGQAARFGFKLPYDLPPTPSTNPNQNGQN